jgi:hypothetical protein
MTKYLEASQIASADLEMLVDRHGLKQVIDMLATICEEKAEHVSINWQDIHLARSWKRDANKLAQWNAKLEN